MADINNESVPVQEQETSVQQTQFAQDLVISSKPELTDEEQAAQKRNRIIKYGILAFIVVMIILTIVAQTMPQRQQEEVEATPTPTPAPAQVFGPLERAMQVLEEDIEAADPVEAEVGFPPVTFDARLEDATDVQTRTRR